MFVKTGNNPFLRFFFRFWDVGAPLDARRGLGIPTHVVSVVLVDVGEHRHVAGTTAQPRRDVVYDGELDVEITA